MVKPIKSWTESEVMEALKQSISGAMYSRVSEAIEEWGIDGVELSYMSMDDVKELLMEMDMKPFHRKKLMVMFSRLKEQLHNQEAADLKYTTSPEDMVFGDHTDFKDGLTTKIQVLERSMEEECTTNDGGKWKEQYDYVVNEEATELHEDPSKPHRIRDLGHNGMRLEDFEKHEMATAASLTQAEVAALRMYTGPFYSVWNSVLRMYSTDTTLLPKWRTCISILYNAIVKLSYNSQKASVYRGINETNVSIPDAFFNASTAGGFAGGVELAFMSTSTDINVAVEYALNIKTKKATVFEIAFDGASRGAQVQWVSQFPYEAELLYPPCTYLTCEKAENLRCAETLQSKGLTADVADLRYVTVRAAVSTARPSVEGITTVLESQDKTVCVRMEKAREAVRHTTLACLHRL